MKTLDQTARLLSKCKTTLHNYPTGMFAKGYCLLNGINQLAVLLVRFKYVTIET